MRTLHRALPALFALALAAVPAAAAGLDKVKVIIPRDSAFVLNYFGGRDAGIFKKHGIDIEIDARPFAGFLAGLPSKEAMVGTYSGMDAIEKMNQGVDWVVIGGGLTDMQQVMVRKDAPYKTITDLRGKVFGTFSTGAGSFKATRAAILGEYKFDVVKDTKLRQVAAPALFHLFESGGVDAMFNISSLTIAAAAQPDKFRAIYVPNDYWKKKTGYPIVWSAPTIAWRSWVDENPTRAKNFVAGLAESFRWLRDPEHLAATIKKYGTLAGVTSEAQAATYKDWLRQRRLFLPEWDQKVIAAQWQFLELAKREGVIGAVPDERKHALSLE